MGCIYLDHALRPPRWPRNPGKEQAFGSLWPTPHFLILLNIPSRSLGSSSSARATSATLPKPANFSPIRSSKWSGTVNVAGCCSRTGRSMLTGGNSASSTPRTHNSRNQTSRARMVVKGVATGSSLVCLGLGDYPSLRCFRSRWRWWRQWRWVRGRRSRRRSLVRGGRYRDILTFSYKRCWHCRVWPSKSRRNRWRSRQLHRRQCPRNGAARRQSRTGAKDRHRKRSPDARHQCGRHRCFLGLFGRGCADRACRRDRKACDHQPAG
ncbi:hypothetical protein ABIB99_006565 [Bradyrhizobium sp. LA6.1]